MIRLYIVEVYSKICSENLDEVGPSWYRLEVINSTTKDLGSFKTQFLAEYSGATLSEDQVRNCTLPHYGSN